MLAQDAAGSGSSIIQFLPIILLFVAMYFILIRPQSKRRREAQQMQSQMSPGDEIQTVGGMFATVVSIDGDVITVEPSTGVQIRFTRGAIARVIKPTEPTTTEDDDVNADAAKTIEQG